ncbi:MAG: hypothetical protein FWD06_03115 [Oscillospiraceae bacterium]|nr:hypothetical protein [Oscillospiraceae bacterium]
MTKKLLAIALAVVFALSLGMVAAASDGYVCACPPDADCAECICVDGECVCPPEEEGRSPLQSFLRSWGWSSLGSWVAMAATVVIAFFVTR